MEMTLVKITDEEKEKIKRDFIDLIKKNPSAKHLSYFPYVNGEQELNVVCFTEDMASVDIIDGFLIVAKHLFSPQELMDIFNGAKL